LSTEQAAIDPTAISAAVNERTRLRIKVLRGAAPPPRNLDGASIPHVRESVGSSRAEQPPELGFPFAFID